MSQPNQEEKFTKYKSQTSYYFAHADTGEVFQQFSEESFTPVPEPGDRIAVGNTTAHPNEEREWKIQDQDFDQVVVTEVEYQYNNVLFESEGEAARRLLAQVWIFVLPVLEQRIEDKNADSEN